MTVRPPAPPCADLWVDAVELAPGSVGVVTVRLRSRLDVPAHFDLALAGVEADWVRGPTSVGPVGPGAVATTELQLRLPVGYPAATLLASVSVRPAEAAGVTVPASADLTIVVGDGSAIGAALDPVEVRGVHGGRFDVVLRNGGKTPVRVDLHADVPDADMRVSFSGAAPVLEPGRELRVKARLRASRPVLGPVQRRHFAVRVQGRTTPVVLEGSLTQRPVLSPWWIRAVALVAVIALWAAVAVVGITALSKHVKRSATARAIAGAPPLTPNHNPSGAAGGAAGGGANGSNGGAAGGSAGGGAANGSGATGTDRVGGRVTASQAGGVKVTVAPTSLVAAAAEGAKTTGGQIVTTADVTGSQTPSSPVPDGKVYASEAGASLDPELTAAVSPTLGTTTTPDGTWAVAGLSAPGTYLVTFAKAGYGTEKYIVSATAGGSSITLNTSLVAGNGVVTGRVLGPSGPLGGVEVAITDGTIKVDTRTPSVGAGVGTWSATGLTTPGTYLVTATDPGYGTQTAVVTLGPGDSASNVVLRMTSGLGDITGEVSSSSGPLGGITVTAAGGDTSVTTTTSTAAPIGSYSLPNLPIPGTYALTVSGIGWVTQTERVTLPDTRPVDAVLRASTGDVNGRITVGADDARPSGVGLILSDQTTSYKTLTANGGGYEFQNIPPGSYLLTAEYYGDQTRSAQVTVTAGAAPVVVNLHLPPNGANSNGQGSIQGLAVDLFSNSPAVGVSVELDGVQSRYKGKPVVTSAQGTYTIRNVVPGEHLVTLVDRHTKTAPPGSGDSIDLETESVDVDVPLNGVGIAPTVDMPKLDDYSGTVQSAATLLPVDGATVTLLESGKSKVPVPGVASYTTDASGTFKLSGIPAGNYLVQVTGPANADESMDYLTETFPLTMSPDVDLQQQTIDLTLLPSFQVVSEQVNTAGTSFGPVSGVCVTLEDQTTGATLPSKYTGQYTDEPGTPSADAGELYFAPLTAGDVYKATYTEYASGTCVAGAVTGTANATTFTAVADNTAVDRVFVTSNVQAITLQLQYAAELDTTTTGPGGTTVAAVDDCTVSSAPTAGACSSYTGAPLTATLTGVASFDASGNPVTTTVTGTYVPGAQTYMFSSTELSAFISSTATLTVAGAPETFATYSQTVDLQTSSMNVDAVLSPQPVAVTGTGTPTTGLKITTAPSTVQVNEGPGGTLVWSDPVSTEAGAAVPGMYQLTFQANDYEPLSGYTQTFTIPLCATTGCTYSLSDPGLVYQPSVTITPSAVTSPATVTLFYDGTECGAIVNGTAQDCPGMTNADSPVTLAAGSSAGATFAGLSPLEEMDAVNSSASGYTFSVVEDGYRTYDSPGTTDPSDPFIGLTSNQSLTAHLTPEPSLTGTIVTYPVVSPTSFTPSSPAVGVTVQATLNSASGACSSYTTAPLTTTTGGDGSFSLYGNPGASDPNGGLCPTGTYTVTVEDPGYNGPTGSYLSYDSGWSSSDAQDEPQTQFTFQGDTGPVSIAAGGTLNLDAANINQTIVVENADGSALPSNLPVNIAGYPQSTSGARVFAATITGSSVTNPVDATAGACGGGGGANTICASVDATAYTVYISAPGYEFLYASFSDNPSASAPATITYRIVPDQNTISGTVTTKSSSGTVAVSGLQVFLYISGDVPPKEPTGITDPVTTQSNGTYSFTGVPDGSYYIAPATGSGYSLPGSPTTFTTSYPNPITQNLTLVASAVVLNVDVGAPALHDSNVSGALVTLTPDPSVAPFGNCSNTPSGSPPTECTGSGKLITTGAATGPQTGTLSGSGTAFTASFSSVTPDVYLMTVSGNGIPTQTGVILEVNPNTGTNAETANVDVSEGELYGTVAVNGSLSSSAPTIAITGGSSNPPAPTCAVGGCSFTAYAAPGGTYTVTASLPGYDTVAVTGLSPGSHAGDSVNAGTLTLNATKQTVTVTATSGGVGNYPLDGATLTLSSSDTGYNKTMTATNGSASFTNVAPDSNDYTLSVNYDGTVQSGGVAVSLNTGGTTESDSVNLAAGQMTGAVTYTGAGNPTVYFCPTDLDPTGAATCGAADSIASYVATGATYSAILPDGGYWVGQSVQAGFTSNTVQAAPVSVNQGVSTTGPTVSYKA